MSCHPYRASCSGAKTLLEQLSRAICTRCWATRARPTQQAWLGCDAICSAAAHLLASLKLITGFCRFKSQTTVVPLLLHDATMCCTFLFHATYVMSVPALLPGAPEAPPCIDTSTRRHS